MTLQAAVLAVHVAAGVAGLLLGPWAVAAAHRGLRSTRAGRAFTAAVTVLVATTLMLVAADPGLWPFALLAAGTQAAAVGAVRAGDPVTRFRLAGAALISLVTALAVVTWGSVLAWVLPVAVGTAAVERAAGGVTGPRSPAPS